MIIKVGNFSAPLTAPPTAVATGTSTKTLLQVNSSNKAEIVRWGISFDGFVAAAPGKVELIEVDVAATVTALTAADCSKIDSPGNDGAAVGTVGLNFSTSTTGFTASAEGTPTVARVLDTQLLPPTGPYVYEFPLGSRPVLQATKYLRIRVTFGTSVNAICWVDLNI